MIHDSHFYHQTDLSLDMQLGNIASNTGRIGNWTLGLFELKNTKGEEIFNSRLKLIKRMISQTDSYLEDILDQNISKKLTSILKRFKQDIDKLKKDQINEDNYQYWAEKALTWAKILTDRAKAA